VSDAALAAALLSALGGVALSLTASTLPARLAARRTVTAELAA
jgi:hypothetical protein